MIAAAKGVAAATAQLVSSSRVKAGTDNPSQKKLQEAAKGVIGIIYLNLFHNLTNLFVLFVF